MATVKCQLVFRGQIATNQHIDEVKRKLAAVYKTDVATIERRLFAGKSVIIKKNLDYQVALKKQAALTSLTGAVFELEAMPSESLAESSSPGSSQYQCSSTEVSSMTSPKRVGFRMRLVALLFDYVLILSLGVPAGILYDKLWDWVWLSWFRHFLPRNFNQFLLSDLVSSSMMTDGYFENPIRLLFLRPVEIFFLQYANLPFLRYVQPLFVWRSTLSSLWEANIELMMTALGICLVGTLCFLVEGLTGASFGKKLLGLHVANADGTQAGKRTLLLRSLFKNSVFCAVIIVGYIGIGLIEIIGFGFGVVWFLGCFFALRNSKQGLHDLMLKTAIYPKYASNAIHAKRTGFCRRFGALLLDSILMVLVGLPAIMLLNNPGVSQFRDTATCVLILLPVFYYLFEGIAGASLGKMMLRIKIANTDGTPVGAGRQLVRFIMKTLVYVPAIVASTVGIGFDEALIGFGVGCAWIMGCFLALGMGRQGLHDIILKTAVYPTTAIQHVHTPQHTLIHTTTRWLLGSVIGILLFSVTYFYLGERQKIRHTPTTATQYKSFGLHSRKLTYLSSEIGTLAHLKSLNLQSHGLTTLPPEVGQLTDLTSLTLSSNNLTALPSAIGQLSNLNAIGLSGNLLTTLPPEIGQLSKLTRLDVSKNPLAEIPPEIGKLRNLKHLELGSCNLTALPSEIGQLINLTYLIISNNPLTTLPPEIGQLTKLTALYLPRSLSVIPPEIGQLINLEELNLSSHHLTVVPPEIGQLASLTRLVLDHNDLTALPPEIGQLTNLTHLAIWENRLVTLPPEFGELTNLTFLRLGDNALTALPPEIGQLTNLTELELWNNNLTELPPEIGQLSNLRKLILSENFLTELPPEIGRLSKLRRVIILDARLAELPPEIGQLTHLTYLNLENNNLTELPPEIGQLSNLRDLILIGNPLTALPPEIGQLSKLQNLYIGDSRVEIEIPQVLHDNPALRILWSFP